MEEETIAQPEGPAPQVKMLNESLFNMWRCVICIAHADGVVQAEEREYLERTVSALERSHGMSPTQKVTLMSDLETPQNLADILPKVTEPQYRGLLIHFGNIMAHADGIVTEDEERLLDMLHAQQMTDIDAEKLRADIQKDMEEHRLELEQETKDLRDDRLGGSPLLKTMDRLLKKIGISVS